MGASLGIRLASGSEGIGRMDGRTFRTVDGWLRTLGMIGVAAIVSSGGAEGIERSVAPGPRPPLSFRSDGQADDGAALVRILSWNVKVGSLFPATLRVPIGEEPATRVGSFGRVLRAVQPDVICLQEIWPLREAGAVTQLLNAEYPLTGGRKWKIHRVADVLIASRYPYGWTRGDLVLHFPLPEMPDFHYGQAMGLIDLPDGRFARDLFLVTTHFRSRSGAENRRLRERHADAILERIRDLRTEGGDLEVPRRTPFVIVGDLNVYESNPDDPLRHLETLVSGRFSDPMGGVKIFAPDWDESSLVDLKPSINGAGRSVYTWRNDGLPYPPGALDRFLFSDSVLEVVESFVLNPSEMSKEKLNRYGLRSGDGNLGGREGEFDHLPMVADLRLRP